MDDVQPGLVLPLTIEKAAAGGRMIARVAGRVILVAGAIPGEHVEARIERVAKGVAYGIVERVDEPSPDRRETASDPACGGCAYAHISYPRQLDLKAQIIADAFARIARLPPPDSLAVEASRQDGYRMRARLHVLGPRIGFFREGTHDVCDARATRQLLPETSDVLDELGAGAASLGSAGIDAIELSENVDASERVVLVGMSRTADARAISRLAGSRGLTGFGIRGGAVLQTVSGDLRVTDVIPVDDRAVTLKRHVSTFFQGNRYLLHRLVGHVVGQIEPGSRVVDLYAGTGLFALAAAAARAARVTAVEGDRTAADDLKANVRAAGSEQVRSAVTPLHRSVEAFLTAGSRPPADVVIADPPRTGLTQDALDGIVRLAPSRVIYVSCDVPTLARDARRLVDGGYEVEQVRAFDMFPNTPHVETVVVFAKR